MVTRGKQWNEAACCEKDKNAQQLRASSSQGLSQVTSVNAHGLLVCASLTLSKALVQRIAGCNSGSAAQVHAAFVFMQGGLACWTIENAPEMSAWLAMMVAMVANTSCIGD